LHFHKGDIAATCPFAADNGYYIVYGHSCMFPGDPSNPGIGQNTPFALGNIFRHGLKEGNVVQ